LEGKENHWQSSGKSRREIAKPCLRKSAVPELRGEPASPTQAHQGLALEIHAANNLMQKSPQGENGGLTRSSSGQNKPAHGARRPDLNPGTKFACEGVDSRHAEALQNFGRRVR
jgi:hypothetical protein